MPGVSGLMAISALTRAISLLCLIWIKLFVNNRSILMVVRSEDNKREHD